MMNFTLFVGYLSVLLLALLGITTADADTRVVSEQPVIEIPLGAPISKPEAEISGMAWYGQWLILLPQYPSTVGDHIYAINKADITAFLDGRKKEPPALRSIDFDTRDLNALPNYQGLEAIAFNGEDVYITIETNRRSKIVGYLVSGDIAPDLSRLTMDNPRVVSIPTQAGVYNYGEESVLYFNGMVMTIHEVNGVNVNESPVIHRFDRQLDSLGTIPFPNIEYRITDATAPDNNGYFRAINYFFHEDRDKLDPAPDSIVAKYGTGATHARNPFVERLVEFQYTDQGVLLTDTAPIQLTLRDDGISRNWEGVVKLDKRGFLLVTDEHPGSILAFVPAPQ
ncbi:MAG: hypothetical protein KJO08_01370 [Gammaproteobacteria bacterium]|nr:hypothetical protein [Gammaproteobacteria bacterium]NNJ84282.1 hypothetical protein [Gammaproteobacteria bacterium]